MFCLLLGMRVNAWKKPIYGGFWRYLKPGDPRRELGSRLNRPDKIVERNLAAM